MPVQLFTPSSGHNSSRSCGRRQAAAERRNCIVPKHGRHHWNFRGVHDQKCSIGTPGIPIHKKHDRKHTQNQHKKHQRHSVRQRETHKKKSHDFAPFIISKLEALRRIGAWRSMQLPGSILMKTWHCPVKLPSMQV